VSKGDIIEILPSAGTATLLHKIAHELLHKKYCTRIITREEKELEAESVAFIVGCYFQLDVSTSANYIALWNGGKEATFEHLERIQTTAAMIISSLESKERENFCV
jgi:hypothetical protein